MPFKDFFNNLVGTETNKENVFKNSLNAATSIGNVLDKRFGQNAPSPERPTRNIAETLVNTIVKPGLETIGRDLIKKEFQKTPIGQIGRAVQLGLEGDRTRKAVMGYADKCNNPVDTI